MFEKNKTQNAEKTLAVFFPGIGYHVDKPLLYYSRKLAKELGFECINISYGDMPENVKGNSKKKQEAFITAKKSVCKILDSVDFSKYERIIFISKSLGSILAADYDNTVIKINAEHVIFTPVQETIRYDVTKGIVFHGTADDWINTNDLIASCEKNRLELYLVDNADHSLETHDTLLNIKNLADIMKKLKEYFKQ